MYYKCPAVIATVLLAFVASRASANSCFVCSTSTSETCMAPPPNAFGVVCPEPANVNGTCFTRVVGRHVERGCVNSLTVADLANCNVVNNCVMCSNTEPNTYCNGAIFPEHRLHCHRCTGTTNSTCGLEIQDTPAPCQYFDAEDSCFVSVIGDQVQRGCLSESEYCQTTSTCLLCNGNGCNFRHFEDSAAGGLVVSLQLMLGAAIVSILCAMR